MPLKKKTITLRFEKGISNVANNDRWVVVTCNCLDFNPRQILTRKEVEQIDNSSRWTVKFV